MKSKLLPYVSGESLIERGVIMSAAQWKTLCRIHIWSHGTKNTLLDGKQCSGTLKRKDFIAFWMIRDVTKISGCWVNTTSSWWIKQLGISFGSSNQKTMGEEEKEGYLTPLPPHPVVFLFNFACRLSKTKITPKNLPAMQARFAHWQQTK